MDTSIAIDASQFFLGFFKSLFGTPAILVGLFSLLGSILLRKKFSEIIISFFKTLAGFLILNAGAMVIQIPLTNFRVLFQDLFKVSGTIANSDAFATQFFKISEQTAQLGSIVMVMAIVLNLILAGFSRFKYVYLTGHLVLYMSIMLATVLAHANNQQFLDLSKPGDYAIALISSALLMSVYMVISAAACKRFVKQISKQDDVSLAHAGSLSYVTAGWIGEAIYKIKKGQNIKCADKINFPKWLQFFKNTFISVSITMLIIFMVIYIPEGIMYNVGKKTLFIPPKNIPVEEWPLVTKTLYDLFGPHAANNWVVQMFLDAFTFAAGVEILLFGVRMIIDEIVPSFKGISTKFIKNSQPSLDCPIVFPYSPNAVIIGFVSSLTAGFIVMGISIGVASHNKVLPVLLPGVIPHFFLGATSGVFGNVKGGIWGCVLGAFINGIIITFIPWVFIGAGWVPAAQLSWGDTDFLLGIVPGVLALSGQVTGRVLIILIPSLIYLALIIDGIIKSSRDKKALKLKINDEINDLNNQEEDKELTQNSQVNINEEVAEQKQQIELNQTT
ncbi:PTS ascorbate transporter subunit IIC [Mycoplasma sp. E35C]|uniref:PTS ascorbate transporter subunit IIC n=1 Tax=Mycoplasma sp. E35C TaxID=2801918 RepID=UPI001CA46A53|nr:PTS ascorbate transporter subunit IIC [Mycoplasma sp. E35C]QZX48828.1 PTS ascorbate transporter subunit IIC [Mycoplasma sp. E35C]